MISQIAAKEQLQPHCKISMELEKGKIIYLNKMCS
jgi:hypothetical protein